MDLGDGDSIFVGVHAECEIIQNVKTASCHLTSVMSNDVSAFHAVKCPSVRLKGAVRRARAVAIS